MNPQDASTEHRPQRSETTAEHNAGSAPAADQQEDGADERDVRTNIGATSGVVPSSYGGPGGLDTVDDADS